MNRLQPIWFIRVICITIAFIILLFGVSEGSWRLDTNEDLIIMNSDRKVYKDLMAEDVDSIIRTMKDVPVIGTIGKNKYFLRLYKVSFEFYRPKFYGGYYFDTSKNKLVYGLIEQDEHEQDRFYRFVVPLLKWGSSIYPERMKISHERILKIFDSIEDRYDGKGETFFFTKKHYERMMIDNRTVTVKNDIGSSVSVFAKTDDDRYYLILLDFTLFNNKKTVFCWVESYKLTANKELLRKRSNEGCTDICIFFLVVMSISVFYFLLQKLKEEKQRAEEIRRQQQRAEAQQAEEENRKKSENLRRQEQERYRQAEELRQQKQWADAHQAEENRRRAEELRRKEEELRRQAEEIKRQKERLDEELKNRRESQAKNIIYPRTLHEAFEVLGTRSGLTLEEYKKIFRNEVIKYHPDKTKSLGERLQKQAEEEMKAINMAWDIIKRSI